MSYDPDAAADYAFNHAFASSQSQCAKKVRLAIKAGGTDLAITYHAKDYGTNLLLSGFQEVGETVVGELGVLPVPIALKKGDVAVIQPYQDGNTSGHMAIYHGDIWVSDFKQNFPTERGPYSGPGYAEKKPPYKIYRYF